MTYFVPSLLFALSDFSQRAGVKEEKREKHKLKVFQYFTVSFFFFFCQYSRIILLNCFEM